MGKRKSARKPGAGKKKVPPLDTVFTCLFCNHEKSVSCKIDDKTRIGYLSCKTCDAKFEADTDALTQPIDVYSLADEIAFDTNGFVRQSIDKLDRGKIKNVLRERSSDIPLIF